MLRVNCEVTSEQVLTDGDREGMPKGWKVQTGKARRELPNSLPKDVCLDMDNGWVDATHNNVHLKQLFGDGWFCRG